MTKKIQRIKSQGFRAGVTVGTMVALIGTLGAPIKWG